MTGEDIFCAKKCLTDFRKTPRAKGQIPEKIRNPGRTEARKEMKSETAAVWRPERTFASMEARRVGVRDEVV